MTIAVDLGRKANKQTNKSFVENDNMFLRFCLCSFESDTVLLNPDF